MASTVHGKLLPISAVSKRRRREMFRLFECYYENVREEVFLADLAEKHWVILLLDPQTDEVCGFSTQMVLDVTLDDQRAHALFSGDTVVARSHWGDIALARVWGRLAISLIESGHFEPLYWFLIVKGFRTYRFLPLYFREFYPRYDASTPERAEWLTRAFAQRRYPQAFDAAASVIRAHPLKDRLRPGVADVTPDRLQNPHVRFFHERNVHHAMGDELCCLAPLTRSNFTPAAWRVIGEVSSATETSV